MSPSHSFGRVGSCLRPAPLVAMFVAAHAMAADPGIPKKRAISVDFTSVSANYARFKATLVIRGNGLRSVVAKAWRKPGSPPIKIYFPVGALFRSDGECQSMVATDIAEVDLSKRYSGQAIVPVAGMNFRLPAPSPMSLFGVSKVPKTTPLYRLLNRLSLEESTGVVRQLAVWVVTDNPTYAEMSAHFAQEFLDRKLEDEDVIEAKRLLVRAGIPTSQAKLFKPRPGRRAHAKAS